MFLPLDGELVIFSEEAQSLFGLNDSAAFVVQKLREGATRTTLVHALTSNYGVNSAEAERWIASALEALSLHSVLDDGRPPTVPARSPGSVEEAFFARHAAQMPPYRPLESPAAEKRYRLLETLVLIRFGHVAQVRLVDAAIGHLETDDNAPPDVVVEAPSMPRANRQLLSDVYRDGKPFARAPRLSMLGPYVKGAVWQSAIDGHGFGFYIHAGVVGTAQTCILLPAAAGGGKSSLTAALVHRGYRYFSDEIALIERGTFLVPPVPVAICVKSTAWDLMARYCPMISSLPIHLREDKKWVKYVPPPSGAGAQAHAPVSRIIFPCYDSEVSTGVQPVRRTQALSKLMGECLALGDRLNPTNVVELVRWIEKINCYALTFSSLDEATDIIDSIVRTPHSQ